jgi:thiamine biosynthesis lipoprotein ApbE
LKDKKIQELIKKYPIKEKEQEERREIMQALQVERTLITRNTRWMDDRGSISDFFTHRSRNVVDRVQNYLDSDERTATILQLQDMMTSSTSQSLRNNSTVLFELQNSFSTIMNTGLSVNRRTHDVFYRIIGAIEYEIRSQVIENLD